MKRRMPISKKPSIVVRMDGINYDIPPSPARSNMFKLQDKGIVAYVDCSQHLKWLTELTECYRKTPELQHETQDNIAGVMIDFGSEGLVWTEITRRPEWKKQVYLINCYASDSRVSEVQILCDISGEEARYGIVPCEKVSVYNLEMLKNAGERASTILLGVKLFINVSKFRLYDELTGKRGSSNLIVEPFPVFGYQDFILKK